MKAAALAAAVLMLCMPLAAENQQLYEPYDPFEFPQWAHDVRRGSIIFFGSAPVTFGVTSLVLPLFYSGDVPGSTRVITALSLSAGIALADWVLGRIQQ